jgi:hypothetical protein
MKMSSNFYRLAGNPPERGHILCVLFVCATAMLATGCHRKNQSSEIPAAPPPTTQSEASPAAPAIQPTAVNSSTTVASTTNGLPDVRALNGALMEWVIQNQRHPASFEEFAAGANIQIPPLPPGKKFILNSRGLISIVSR